MPEKTRVCPNLSTPSVDTRTRPMRAELLLPKVVLDSGDIVYDMILARRQEPKIGILFQRPHLPRSITHQTAITINNTKLPAFLAYRRLRAYVHCSARRGVVFWMPFTHGFLLLCCFRHVLPSYFTLYDATTHTHIYHA